MNDIIFSSEHILNSEKSSISLVEPILEKLKKHLGIKDENFYNVMIAVTEGINNAINHGNKLNPRKKVNFVVQADKANIYIKISDEGDGFDPDSVANCLDPENLLKSSGRGVFIIRELMDELKITSGIEGTTLEMCYTYNAN